MTLTLTDGRTVELIPARPGVANTGADCGAGEHLRVTSPDAGTSAVVRLQDYAFIYDTPGLYQAVVQGALDCRSPRVLASLLAECAGERGVFPTELRALDLAAGCGESGAALAALAISTPMAFDVIPEARAAARRDHPDVYAEYHVADELDLAVLAAAVEAGSVNTLVCVGALGHLGTDALSRVWDLFPTGSWLAVTFYDATSTHVADPLVDPASNVAAWLRDEHDRRALTRPSARRYRHRLAMDGSEIPGAAAVARRTGPGNAGPG